MLDLDEVAVIEEVAGVFIEDCMCKVTEELNWECSWCRLTWGERGFVAWYFHHV
jgi:hypothetical protein